MQCLTCKSEMRLVPAGISKSTGKPYSEFWSCPNRCPKPKSIYTPTPKTPSDNGFDKDWTEAYNGKKTDGMSELNAKKTAGEYANLMLELGKISDIDWQSTFETKANEIYNTHCFPF